MLLGQSNLQKMNIVCHVPTNTVYLAICNRDTAIPTDSSIVRTVGKKGEY